MKKNMIGNLFIFILGGIVFRWVIDIGDILLQNITNKQTVSATKTQLELNKLVEDKPDEYIETSVMGFQAPEEEYFEDDEYE